MQWKPASWSAVWAAVTMLLTAVGVGCSSGPAPVSETGSGHGADDATTTSTPATRDGGSTDQVQPLAYINGQAIDARELMASLIETAGGEVLAETVLDRLIERRLERRGLTVTADDLEQERNALLATLSDDPDEAALLLRRLRERRGLGERRFDALLRRNAGLRKLVRDEVTVTRAALNQAYRERYGERYRARLIVVPSVVEANRLRARAIEQPSRFGELAALHSTDASAVQGGLLPDISPVDATYPAAVRQALESLEPGQVSDIISLDQGFAILKLEQKIEPRRVAMADVEQELAERVQRQGEGLRMQQLARELLTRANVVTLNPGLSESWRRQLQQIAAPELTR